MLIQSRRSGEKREATEAAEPSDGDTIAVKKVKTSKQPLEMDEKVSTIPMLFAIQKKKKKPAKGLLDIPAGESSM